MFYQRAVKEDRHRLLDLLEATTELPAAGRMIIQGLLEEGKAFLLLDGLDEVANESLRERVIAIFFDAARAWSKSPMVVSSRPFGAAVLTQRGFSHAVIEPFDRPQIREFIDYWVKALTTMGIAQRENRQSLQQAILDRPTIRLLASNPVMLTCLCVVHWNEGKLPEGRARVYRAVMTWLIAARREKRIAWFTQYPGVGVTAEKCDTDRLTLEAFATMALAMMLQPKGKAAVIDVQTAAKSMEPLLKRFFPDMTRNAARIQLAREWVKFECLGSGIVVELGNQRLKFWHLTFQEYLAAYALALLGDGDYPDEDWWPVLQKHSFNPQWRETIGFFPGTLFDEGGRRRVDLLLKRVLDLRGDLPDLAKDAKIAGLLGGLLEPLRVYGYSVLPRTQKISQQIMNRTLEIFTIEGAAQVSIEDRIAAAEALGQSGDPRLAREKFNKPEYFIEIPNTGWRLRKYPVTVMEFQDFVEHANGYQNRRWWDDQGWIDLTNNRLEAPKQWVIQQKYPNRPVTGVSAFEAMAYCRWLSELRGETIHLPSLRLLQQAASSPHGKYPWGAAVPNPTLANYGGNIGNLTPVGLYPAGNGPFGHCDLAGNVYEWCFPNSRKTIQGIIKKEIYNWGMAIYGGGCLSAAGMLSSPWRTKVQSGTRFARGGFRVASPVTDQS